MTRILIIISAPRECLERFSDDMLYTRLSDGREIGVPIAWFPRLQNATPEARARWSFIGRGIGIRWD
ncbi:MAG: DUF2442 domain-containing protein [Bacillota bacterium]|nr:DUF2442 domain-containing protein [Bacillota bacterium]